MAQVFISHASADGAAAAGVADALRGCGHGIFLDADQADGLAPGADWLRVLLRELRACDVVVFLNSTAGQASMWCHSELVVATGLSKRIYALDVEPGRGPHPLLRHLQGIGFGADLDTGIRRLVDGLAADGLAGNLMPGWRRGRPPFPGLAAMDVADAGVFFGRDGEIRGLMARVEGPLGRRDGDLVVVTGPSGAGKSSLVRAGLVARLGLRGPGWAVAAPFEPGIRPLDRLAGALAAVAGGQMSGAECRRWLLGEGLAAFAEQLAAQAGARVRRLLVTVDQAEQLAAVTAPALREEFTAVLGSGLGAGSLVTVVLTARSDRFAEIQQLPVLGPAVRTPFVIGPLPSSRLAEVIEGPAQRAGLMFAPGLAGRIAADAARGREDTADALPLLAFTLREMYDRLAAAGRDCFTAEDYELAGRIDGAITQRTCQAEESLPAGSGPVLDKLLPRFVTIADGRQPAGRPVSRDQLTAAERAIVVVLEDQRLVTGTSEAVRLAHERLITAWSRLAAAVALQRDDLALQARLERQAQDWTHGVGGLPGREVTAAAAAWLARRAAPGTSNTAVGGYVRAAQRAIRRRRAVVASVLTVVTVLAVAASAAAVVAFQQRAKALAARDQAIASQIITEADQLAAADPSLAAQLDLAASQLWPSPASQARLIATTTTPLARRLTGPATTVSSVAFSPHGRILAASATDQIWLWNMASPDRPARLRSLPTTLSDHITSIAFSPDGHTLAAGAFTGDSASRVWLWNMASPDHPARLGALPTGVLDGITSIAFSPDGHILAAGSEDSTIWLWNMAHQDHPAPLGPPLTGPAGRVTSVAFSLDGKTLAAGSDDNTIWLWNMAHQDHPAPLGPPLTGPAGRVTSVAFSPDGKTLAAASSDKKIWLWNLAAPARPARLGVPLNGAANSVTSVMFSPDGHTLAAGSDDNTIGLWSLPPSLPIGGQVSAVAFSQRTRILAADTTGHKVWLWDLATPARPAQLGPRPRGPAAGIYWLAFSPGGHTLVAATSGSRIWLWNLTDPAHPAPAGPPLTENYVTSVAFSPDGKTLAAGNGDNTVWLWNLANSAHPARLRPPLTGPAGIVTSVAFSPDGKTLAAGSGSGDNRVFLWNLPGPARSARLRPPLTGPAGIVTSVAFSPDGKTLAAGSDDNTVWLWSLAHPDRPAQPLTGPRSAVNTVAFSPDGHILAAGTRDGPVWLWNLTPPARPAPLGPPLTAAAASVTSVAFSPDGNALAAASDDRTIWLWNLNIDDATRRICTTTNTLTTAQWHQYIALLPYNPPCAHPGHRGLLLRK